MSGAVTVQPRALVRIIEERCKACELCVLSCPQMCLKLSTRLNRAGFHPAEFTYQGATGVCGGCGVCYWVCPDAAISEVLTRARN